MRLVHTCTSDLSTVSTEVILGQHSRLLTYCALLPQPCTQIRSHFPHTRKSWIQGIGTCRLGHSPGHFESCILISQGLDAKTRGHQHIAYVCTDARIAYGVVTKYAFCNCTSNVSSQVLPGYPHSSASAYDTRLSLPFYPHCSLLLQAE